MTESYGRVLIERLKRDIERIGESLADRSRRIMECRTDMDDCFVSEGNDQFMLHGAQQKIALIKSGGLAWFKELATLDGVPVPSRWFDGKWGERRRVDMPDGKTVWTSATTAKGLAKHGLKEVACLRPAWFTIESQGIGWENWRIFPSNKNYATGEDAEPAPVQMQDWDTWVAAGGQQPWWDDE